MRALHPESTPFGKIMLVFFIFFLSGGLKTNAQSTSSGPGGNTYAAGKFLGWGATSGDLLFNTNNVTRMVLKNTTGYFGIGTVAPVSMFSVGPASEFQINASGNIVRINGISYSFPGAQGSAGAVLMNNGSGTLTWTLAVGPTGATGPNGFAGPPGVSGPTGLNGATGVTGANGINGAMGATGPAGLNGATGMAGPTGPTGTFSGSAWGTTGNSAMVDGVNFIGTTNNVPLSFRVNNQIAGRIDPLQYNTFYGYQSGSSIAAAGYNNTANGYQTLTSNDNGSNNTACGAQALWKNTFAGDNTATGFRALMSNTTGGGNTANGSNALISNMTGYGNTASGFYALESNQLGNSNTAIGYTALRNNIFGNNNTALGAGTDVLIAGLNNVTLVGYNAKAEMSNSLILGGTGTDAVNVGIGTNHPSSKLQVVGLLIFANNAAAIAGGLTQGAFYRTGADPDVVCVVH